MIFLRWTAAFFLAGGPLGPLTEAADILLLPQFPLGDGIVSEVTLLNPGAQPLQGRLRVFAADGRPEAVSADGGPLVLEQEWRVPGGGIRKRSIRAPGPLRGGYAVLDLESGASAPAVQLVYSFGDSEISLPAVSPVRRFQAAVDDGGDLRSALAVLNFGPLPTRVSLLLRNPEGTALAEKVLFLAAGGQVARFLEELFGETAGPLKGTVEVQADEPVAAVALRLHRRGTLSILASSRAEPPPRGDPGGPSRFSGSLALQHVAEQSALGSRPTGSSRNYLAANLIAARLQALGWEVAEDVHTVQFGNVPVTVRNLVGHRGLGSPSVLLGAHYDTRVVADRDDDPQLRAAGSPGANDGGSGVGVLLEMARLLAGHYDLEREIRLVFFDAEDNGGLTNWRSASDFDGWAAGSSLYAAQIQKRGDPVELLIVVDMIGDTDQLIPMEGHSHASARQVTEQIWSAAAELGYAAHFPAQVGSPIIDDHLPFLRLNIPSVLLIDFDYPHWHTGTDTLDKVSAQSLERVGRTLQNFLEKKGFIRLRP